MKKKIAFILGSMGRGGAERVISILSNDYASRGWDTDICVLLKNEVKYELNPKTKIFDIVGQGNSRILRVPFWIKSIRSYIKKEKPDVILSFAARINVLVLLASRGLNVGVVVSERNDPKYDGRGIPTRIMTRLLYPKAKAVIFQTQRVWAYFSKKIKKKGIIIPNPIIVPAFETETNDNKIVNVGSLKEQKNHKLLIEAFRIIHDEYPDKKLYIYGEGACRKSLEEQIIRLGLQHRVFLMGEKADVHEEIKDSLMFVLSSDYEGLSNALLEAMCMGLPCISTACAGADEYIENKKNGIIVNTGDLHGLVEAMKMFIKNPQLRVDCANNAKKTINKVGANIVIERWREIIEK